MKFKEFINKFKFGALRLNLGFLETEIEWSDVDRKAAWELYVELITRITTQPLPAEVGDEASALSSVYSLFLTTRTVLKDNGPRCENFARIAVVVLNQVVRPFTAKWHRLALAGAFQDQEQTQVFRAELAAIQVQLRNYTRLLADMAGVEDLTDVELDEA